MTIKFDRLHAWPAMLVLLFSAWLGMGANSLAAVIPRGVQVVVDVHGNQVAVWQEVSSTPPFPRVTVSSLYDASIPGWTTPQVISNTGFDSYAPKLVMDPLTSVTVAAWLAVDAADGVHAIHAANLVPALPFGTSLWSTAVVVSTSTQDVNSNFQVSMANIGTGDVASIIWTAFDSSIPGWDVFSTFETYTIVGNSFVSWGSPAQLSIVLEVPAKEGERKSNDVNPKKEINKNFWAPRNLK